MKQRVSHYLECHERDWVPDQEKIFGENIRFDGPQSIHY